jgi:hypothetical protein
MTTTGGEIIKLKDRIHTLWFDLQRTKRGNHGHSFLQKPIYDEIISLGHEVVNIVKQIDPHSPFIKRIERPLFEAERKSWTAEDVTFIGPKPYYVMSPEVGESLITQDINRLANQVHHAGMGFIKARQEYCGCKVAESVDLDSINTGVLKYCEGALNYYGRRAWIMDDGDTVEHRPGAASSHANVIRFVPTEQGNKVELDYSESGDDNWKDRQNGLVNYIQRRGGSCETRRMMSRCTMPNLADDEILKLALMVSQLKDIDLLSKDCIPMAFDLIEAQADELRVMEPEEEIWNQKWEVVSDTRQMTQCQGRAGEHESEEERRRREDVSARRLSDFIGMKADEIASTIHSSKREPCTAETYFDLAAPEYIDAIYEACQNIKTKTNDPWAWCMDLVEKSKRDMKEAAGELINRCPPEGILLGLEVKRQPYYIEGVEQVCALADSQDCLDTVRQIRAREKAGIKPAKLDLRYGGP